MFRKSETARTQLSGKNIILNDRPSPNIMQVVNKSVYLKKSFSGRWASALFHSRPRPHTRARGHLLEAEAAKNWPRG